MEVNLAKCRSVCLGMLRESMWLDASFRSLPFIFNEWNTKECDDAWRWQMAMDVGRVMMNSELQQVCCIFPPSAPAIQALVLQAERIGKLQVCRFSSGNDDETFPFTSFQEASMQLRAYEHAEFEREHNKNTANMEDGPTVSLEMVQWCKLPCMSDAAVERGCHFTPLDDCDREFYSPHLTAAMYENDVTNVNDHVEDVLRHISELGKFGGGDDESSILHLLMAPWVAELVVVQCCIFPFCLKDNFVSICMSDDPSYSNGGNNLKMHFSVCHEYGRSFDYINTRMMNMCEADIEVLENGTVVEISFSVLECEELSSSSKRCSCANCESFLARNLSKTGLSCLSDMEDMRDWSPQ